MRAAIYTRVSTTDQSCERQVRDLLAFAERAGYEVVQVFTDTASGAKNDRAERRRVVALARDRRIDAVLVTELTRWGRSTTDLLSSLRELEAFGVSVVAQTGLQFDLTTPQGKLFATMLAALAEFERDLIRERVRSGVVAAQARGVRFGRKVGDRPKSDRLAPAVMRLIEAGVTYREVAKRLEISKTTVVQVVKRHRGAAQTDGHVRSSSERDLDRTTRA